MYFCAPFCPALRGAFDRFWTNDPDRREINPMVFSNPMVREKLVSLDLAQTVFSETVCEARGGALARVK